MATGSDPLVPLKISLKRQGRYARHLTRRAAVMLRYRSPGLPGVPVLFANSFPKSGTHLLSQILEGFTNLGPAVNSGLPVIVTYDNQTGVERPIIDLLTDLRRLQPGDIGFGHLHAVPEIVARLCQPDYAAYFILRDPRDVVVSHVHYVAEMAPGHFHHTYYTQELHSFDERLRTSILGLPEGEAPFPNIALRFAPFVGWLDRTEVLTLRFEDLIQDQMNQLTAILQHAVRRGFPLHMPEADTLQILQTAIDPQRSPTFRSGKTGGWREKFSAANKALFKEVAGDLLIQLGYENGYDW